MSADIYSPFLGDYFWGCGAFLLNLGAVHFITLAANFGGKARWVGEFEKGVHASVCLCYRKSQCENCLSCDPHFLLVFPWARWLSPTLTCLTSQQAARRGSTQSRRVCTRYLVPVPNPMHLNDYRRPSHRCCGPSAFSFAISCFHSLLIQTSTKTDLHPVSRRQPRIPLQICEYRVSKLEHTACQAHRYFWTSHPAVRISSYFEEEGRGRGNSQSLRKVVQTKVFEYRVCLFIQTRALEGG